MTEEEKKQVAAFRFAVICELALAQQMEPGEQERLIREKCARKWQIPFSSKSRISRSTLLRWIRVYKQSGGRLESLYPAGRSDRGKSRSLDEDTCQALITLRRELPRATAKKLIEQMQRRRLVILLAHARLMPPRAQAGKAVAAAHLLAPPHVLTQRHGKHAKPRLNPVAR